MIDDVHLEKKRIRQQMQDLRREVSQEVSDRAAHDILTNFFEGPGLQLEPGDAVAIFSPIRGEPDFYGHRSLFFERKLTLCLPRVDHDGMHFYAVRPQDQLVPGTFGLSEPGSDCPRIAEENLRVIICPGLAFSRRGERIGFGAGYYDRFFAQEQGDQRALRVGACYDFQVFESLPQEENDVRMDLLVTPEGVYPTQVPGERD